METTFNLTTANFGQVRAVEYEMVVLPWGAIEPHNYHLPYLTDCIISQSLALEAAQLSFEKYGVRTMVMPPVFMGSQNVGQFEEKFCIHYRYETQKAILADTVYSLYKQGFRRLIIINGHGGNCFKNMIRDLAVDFPEFTIAVSDWFMVISPDGFFDIIGSHADEVETSLVMHYRPELINLDTAGAGSEKPFSISSLNEKMAWTPRDWKCVSEDTGVGDPRAATAEKGEKFSQALVEKYAKLFNEFTKEDLYLK